MIRYLKQRDETSCGPIAVMNALKWAGLRVTEKTHKKKMRQLTNCQLHHGRGFGGCFPYDIDYALSQYESINVYKKYDRVTFANGNLFEEINLHLDKGGSLLIRYFCKPGRGHYTLCTSRTPRTYTLVNDSSKKTVINRSRMTMNHMLQTVNDSLGMVEHPVIWFLKRK